MQRPGRSSRGAGDHGSTGALPSADGATSTSRAKEPEGLRPRPGAASNRCRLRVKPLRKTTSAPRKRPPSCVRFSRHTMARTQEVLLLLHLVGKRASLAAAYSGPRSSRLRLRGGASSPSSSSSRSPKATASSCRITCGRSSWRAGAASGAGGSGGMRSRSSGGSFFAPGMSSSSLSPSPCRGAKHTPANNTTRVAEVNTLLKEEEKIAEPPQNKPAAATTSNGRFARSGDSTTGLPVFKTRNHSADSAPR
jgi:hypothetical protein